MQINTAPFHTNKFIDVTTYSIGKSGKFYIHFKLSRIRMEKAFYFKPKLRFDFSLFFFVHRTNMHFELRNYILLDQFMWCRIVRAWVFSVMKSNNYHIFLIIFILIMSTHPNVIPRCTEKNTLSHPPGVITSNRASFSKPSKSIMARDNVGL